MLTALIAALFAAPAAAADHQLDLDVGIQGAGYANESWRLFSSSDVLTTYGVRAGVALGEHLSVLLGYQRGVTGADVIYQNDYWDDEQPVDGPGDQFIAAYYSNTLALGPKLSTRLSRSLSPYGTLLLTGQYATVRLDADQVFDDDATQLTSTGMAPGAVAAVGLDAALPYKQRSWTPATFAELGYGHTLALDFDGLGELRFSGVYFRWGLGVRF